MYTLEICTDSYESVLAAQNGGADRVELCSNLVIGGTSPSVELFNMIKENCSIKVNVLIRPRYGDFCYSDCEFELIKREVKLFKSAGANGVVVGILKPDGNFDIDKMARLRELAGDMDTTVHRAFDVCLDPFSALEDIKKLGFKNILTSGQKNAALEGVELLGKLQEAAGVLNIMPGGGVNYEAVSKFTELTSIKSFHMSAKKKFDSPMIYRKEGRSPALSTVSEYERWLSDEKEIRKVKELLNTAVKH